MPCLNAASISGPPPFIKVSRGSFPFASLSFRRRDVMGSNRCSSRAFNTLEPIRSLTFWCQPGVPFVDKMMPTT